jgi:hypothetical protein
MAKKKQSYLKQKKSFSGSQILLFTLVFAAVGAVAIWQSLAAPHNGGGSKPSGGGTISLVLPPDRDTNSDGLPNWGDAISFNVSTTATTSPFVNLQCYQNGALVENDWRGYFVGSLDYPNRTFGLGSGGWQSGAADCTSYIKYYSSHGKINTVASTNFHVNP